MIRLIIVVEGQTEEHFVNNVLQPHLSDRQVYTSATIVGKMIAQRRGHQGRGGGHFRHWQKDIKRILAGDRREELRVTTLFDLYGLPSDFPGFEPSHSDANTVDQCASLETALASIFPDHTCPLRLDLGVRRSFSRY